ncbi:MAG: PIN domain-containing protein [Tannerella sp.]|jgi:predicted nucleic acid-binding protein|nr:PIN domain-containing protein [Tannerella sp.]
MKILVDTSVWSLAFRRNKLPGKDDKVVNKLIDLIRESNIAIIGAVRQELLSGISEESVFENLKEKMSIFPDYVIQTSDYEMAAEYSNKCRKNGIQGSHTDFLICAVAVKNGWKIFTEDNDFLNYRKYIPIILYE